jgi:hypothetical protein
MCGLKFFYFSGTILHLSCSQIQKCDRAHIEAMLSIFRRADHQQITAKRPRGAEERLPAGQALAVIGGLSVLSWAVLISAVAALRGLL